MTFSLDASFFDCTADVDVVDEFDVDFTFSLDASFAFGFDCTVDVEVVDVEAFDVDCFFSLDASALDAAVEFGFADVEVVDVEAFDVDCFFSPNDSDDSSNDSLDAAFAFGLC